MRPGRALFACVLGWASAGYAQTADSAEYAKGRSYPWIAHSSVDAFYLSSPAEPGQSSPYQISLYQGFTIQSLSFAWFHIGLRSRETYVPGFDEAYREPMVLKLQGPAGSTLPWAETSLCWTANWA